MSLLVSEVTCQACMKTKAFKTVRPQRNRFMESDLRLRDFDLEASLPSTAIRSIRPAAPWMYVVEHGIHNLKMGHIENKLVDPDADRRLYSSTTQSQGADN